jgi:hypothetical protein
MSTTNVTPPFPLFTDNDGAPLDNGFVYIGTANMNPVSNPIAVFWDSALTISAAQPIRTINGFPSRNGTPGVLFVGSDYSITVKDKNGVQQLTNPSGARAGLGSIVLAATESLTAESGSSIVLEDGSVMEIGDATGTGVTVTFASNARVVGNVLPNVTGTQALGSTARRWDVFADTVNTADITATGSVTAVAISPDVAGGGNIGSNALPYADVVTRNARVRTVQVYGADQPAAVGDLVELNQRVMTVASMVQTSSTATPAFVENYNCDTASSSRGGAGSYTVKLRVAPTGFAHPIVTIRGGTGGIGTAIYTAGSLDVSVQTTDAAGTPTDLGFYLTLIGYPTVADPIT